MPTRPEPAAAAATTLDDSDESATVALYRAAIGPVRCDYYLPVFTRFDAADRAGPSWNWAACLGTLNWMVFRQLWGPALAYAALVAGLVLVTLGIGRLSGAPFGIATLCALVALATLSFLVPGFFGNALFFAHNRKRMARALAATDTVAGACVLLNRQSTTRQRGAWLALGNAALAGAAIAVYLAPPPALPLAGAARQPADTRNPGARQAGEAATPALRAPSASAAVAGQLAASQAVPAAAAVAPSDTVIAGLTRNPPMPANQSPGPDRPIRRDQPTSVASAPTVATPATPAPAASAIADVAPRASAPKAPAAKQTPEPKLTPPSEPAPPPAAAQVPAAAPTPGPAGAEQRAPAAASTPRYFINVGLFAKDGNAQRAHAKLLAAGLAAFTQELDTPNGKRTRVRAGPFDDRAQADDAAAKIRALELEAMVFRQ